MMWSLKDPAVALSLPGQVVESLEIESPGMISEFMIILSE